RRPADPDLRISPPARKGEGRPCVSGNVLSAGGSRSPTSWNWCCTTPPSPVSVSTASHFSTPTHCGNSTGCPWSCAGRGRASPSPPPTAPHPTPPEPSRRPTAMLTVGIKKTRTEKLAGAFFPLTVGGRRGDRGGSAGVCPAVGGGFPGGGGVPPVGLDL